MSKPPPEAAAPSLSQVGIPTPCTRRLQASPAASLHPLPLLPSPPTLQLRIYAMGG